jgi:hypothetical protein
MGRAMAWGRVGEASHHDNVEDAQHVVGADKRWRKPIVAVEPAVVARDGLMLRGIRRSV